MHFPSKKTVQTAALAGFCLVAACAKQRMTPNDKPPVVSTDSVVKQADGSVKVYGSVTSDVKEILDISGFCIDTKAGPDTLRGVTAVTDTFGNLFYTHIPANYFSAAKTYYFRAVAANRYGLSYGGDVTISALGFDTSTIPCRPKFGHIVFSGAPYAADNVFSYVDPVGASPFYSFQALCSSHSIVIEFNAEPREGIYKINQPGGGDNLTMRVDGYAVDAGALLYVQRISAGVYDITICSASTWAPGGPLGTLYKYNFTTKFRTPS